MAVRFEVVQVEQVEHESSGNLRKGKLADNREGLEADTAARCHKPCPSIHLKKGGKSLPISSGAAQKRQMCPITMYLAWGQPLSHMVVYIPACNNMRTAQTVTCSP